MAVCVLIVALVFQSAVERQEHENLVLCRGTVFSVVTCNVNAWGNAGDGVLTMANFVVNCLYRGKTFFHNKLHQKKLIALLYTSPNLRVKCPLCLYTNPNFATNVTAKCPPCIYTNPNFATN